MKKYFYRTKRDKSGQSRLEKTITASELQNRLKKL